MPDLIKVGMAEYKVGRNPDILITYGLGSCVGIAIYDPIAKIGGLAHIMLPDSAQARSTDNLAKFADTALPVMVEEIIKLGAYKLNIWAKCAGGAQMFKEAEKGAKEINVERTEEALSLNPDVIAVGCPFCNTMMTDGVKHFNKEQSVKVLDVAELVVQANKL